MISVWKPIVLILVIVAIVKLLLLMKAYQGTRRGRLKSSRRETESEDHVQSLTLRLQAVESERRVFAEKIQEEKKELARERDKLSKKEATLQKSLERILRGLSARVEEVIQGRDPGILRAVLNEFRQVSDVSAKDIRLNPHVFFLKPLLSELEEETKSLRATEEIGLTFDLSEGFSLAADPDAVKRILSHLITGLYPLCGKGDVFKIIAGDGEAWTRLAVFKSGQGIPQEDLPDVFEIFPKFADREPQDANLAENAFQNSGLDLILAKRLAEAQGGQISVENLPNGGCRFLVTFPKKQ
jgi:signal transduction histidine kinase